MEALGTLVGQLGFPIGIALVFVYQNKQLNDKFIEVAIQSSVDSQATTKALNEVVKLKERDSLQQKDMKELIIRLERKLDRLES